MIECGDVTSCYLKPIGAMAWHRMWPGIPLWHHEDAPCQLILTNLLF
jgi:hypothetical protein